MIDIFNRSYYEDVLVVRVPPGTMEVPQKDRPGCQRFLAGEVQDINSFESTWSGTVPSSSSFSSTSRKDEQKRRLLDRLDHKEKYWKFSTADSAERQFWDRYTKVYEEMLSATSTDYAPWFIVPGDHKWAARTFVAEVITSAIGGLDLIGPKISAEQLNKLWQPKKS